MGYGKLKIDGVAVKNPTSFRVEKYTLTKSTRVSNGDMSMDFVANKRKVTISYEQINDREIGVLEDVLWGNLVNTKQCFHSLEYYENGSTEPVIMTVYSGAIPKQLHRGDGRLWVWKDVSISLIEK